MSKTILLGPRNQETLENDDLEFFHSTVAKVSTSLDH